MGERVGPKRVFVSYRRQDAAPYAGRIYDWLVLRLGKDSVFMDVDSIQPGSSFKREIRAAVGACAVLLAVIGEGWLEASDSRGRRRLDDPDDIVRLEIEAALARRIPVVPVLVNDALLPHPDELPASLRELTARQAVRVRDDSFGSDARYLVNAVLKMVGAAKEPDGRPDDRGSADAAPGSPKSALPDGPAFTVRQVAKSWRKRIFKVTVVAAKYTVTVEVTNYGWAGEKLKLGINVPVERRYTRGWGWTHAITDHNFNLQEGDRLIPVQVRSRTKDFIPGTEWVWISVDGQKLYDDRP